ncbi:MAG TPA: hypothetical protein VLY63_11765 [Anaerolineae bacterium]|nr:hypothetical protein [Anaerolineae bacterium]
MSIAGDVELVRHVLIPMGDGVCLAADLYVPAGREITDRWPVVVECTA